MTLPPQSQQRHATLRTLLQKLRCPLIELLIESVPNDESGSAMTLYRRSRNADAQKSLILLQSVLHPGLNFTSHYVPIFWPQSEQLVLFGLTANS